MSGSDSELLRRARQGDEQALAELLDCYSGAVYAELYHRLGPVRDRDDLAQEVWLRVFKRLSTLRNEDSFAPWLRAIILHVCQEHLRSRRRWPGRLDERSMSNVPGPESSAEKSRFDAERLDELLAALDPPLREVLVLKYMTGMRYKQMAEFLDVSVPTINARLAKARMALRREMAKAGL